MPDFWPGRLEWRNKLTHRLFFDPCCVLCARYGQSAKDLCISCEKLFIEQFTVRSDGLRTGLCTGCGLETIIPEHCRNQSDWHFCASCRSKGTPLLTSVVAPYRYEFPLDRLIQRMKYHSDRTASRVLGTLLAESVKQRTNRADMPDYLVPVPLHPDRHKLRGYNQAEDIARWCGQILQVGVRPGIATRVVDTPSMAGVGRAERQYQILGAFRVAEVVYGKRIAIVDDVLTTGSTARELARELYDSGAELVDLWVLARTSSPLAS